ncbi:MAG: hypothetical protein IT373_37775, partial [Polyangiaceae bacterium]|nr:hypothetical protein [Polyangiaceae bacterium]
LPPLGPTLAALHLDPTRDLARAYVSAPQLIGSAAAVLVLEHRVPEARLRQAIDALIALGGDTAGWERLEAPNSATGLSIARVLVDGEPRALAPVAPDVLVVLPGELAEEAPRFVGTGGAPDPVGPELLLITLREPKLALVETGLAAFPDSLASLSLTVTLTPNGGADLAVDALSTTPEQALLDAARLTKLVADESAIDLGPVRFTLFDTPTFHADGSRLHADRHLTPAELALLCGVARQLSAGGALAPEAVMGWVGEASLELVGVVGGLIVGR